MNRLEQFEVWYITGSQHLYGDETLKQVDIHSQLIANYLNNHSNIKVKIVFKPVVKTADEILNICRAANNSSNCVGIITWMHTFSPGKMWIRGLNDLKLPILHFHTQFNRDIPFSTIDMDFMNLNQSAHGDREFGHLLTKMKICRKIVVGHWQDEKVIEKINIWTRVSAGLFVMKQMKIARFGDNMRYVAVTEGDKVSSEIKFGFSVNTYSVGDLVKVINEITPTNIELLLEEYESAYNLVPTLLKGGKYRPSLIEAARIELGIQQFLKDGGFSAYTNTFEDLNGMRQLPGIASQRMMMSGYGFGAEGDWKTAALLHICKIMAQDLPGGNSFMEDYTYHFDPLNPFVLGSHMLEICPSISSKTPSCEIHPLGIGGKEDPVRLVFDAAEGPALNISLIDLGNRYRLIVNEVTSVSIHQDFPKLPTAKVLWKPKPTMEIGLQGWLLSGGAHHTVFSQNLTSEYLADFSEALDIEMVLINDNTTLSSLKNELKINENYYA